MQFRVLYTEMTKGIKYSEDNEYDSIFKHSMDVTDFLKKISEAIGTNRSDAKALKVKILKTIRETIKETAEKANKQEKSLTSGAGAQKIETAAVFYYLTDGRFSVDAIKNLSEKEIISKIKTVITKHSEKIFIYIKRYFYSKASKKKKKLYKIELKSDAQIKALQDEITDEKKELADKKKSISGITDPKQKAKENIKIKKLSTEIEQEIQELKNHSTLKILIKKLKNNEVSESEFQSEINDAKKIDFNSLSSDKKIRILESYIKYIEGNGALSAFQKEILQ